MSLIFLLFCYISGYANVDSLYLKSLSSSKQVEILNLEEENSKANLDAVTSSLYPSLDINNSNTYQKDYDTDGDGDNKIDSDVYLSLSQKLFQGGAEFALNDYRKLVPKQAAALREQNLSEYYREYTRLYFQVSSAKEENEKIEALLNNLKKRLSIVRKRAKIGRDRKADLLALESQMHKLESDLLGSKAQFETALTNFKNFSGLENIGGFQNKINPLKLTLVKDRDLGKIPSLSYLEHDYQASLIDTRIEKSKYYPQVDLNTNYYLNTNEYNENDWAVSVNVKLNLFDFGVKSSSVQSKNVQANIKNARLEYGKRNAKNDWNNFVNNFDVKKNELVKLKKALKSSKASYQEQLQDLEKGLVTQIEVIRSLDDVIELEKLVIRSALNVKSLYYQANAFLGNLPKE